MLEPGAEYIEVLPHGELQRREWERLRDGAELTVVSFIWFTLTVVVSVNVFLWLTGRLE